MAGRAVSVFLFCVVLASSYGSGTEGQPTELPEDFSEFFLNEINTTRLRENLKILARDPHLAGTVYNNEQGSYIADLWRSYGFDSVEEVPYNVLLSYPNPKNPNKVELLDDKQKVLFTSSHTEDILRPEDAHPDFVHLYTSYSPNGTVEGELVYVHFGLPSDFELLESMEVNITGKIAVAQYGKIFRGNKVLLAARYGAVGIILYSDPLRFAQEGEEPDQVYPSTMWLQGSGAQRGNIQTIRGDAQTPNYPSLENAYRIPVDELQMPRIPCQPVGYRDARRLLGLLGGQEVPASWKSSSSIVSHIGPGFVAEQPARTVRLTVNNYLAQNNITNVIGVIKGAVEPDRYVLVGNHRDAWGFGAVDASSGTSQMLEVGRAFGKLRQRGWRPRRTLVFCSWDAEELGLIGSSEWVEDHLVKLSHRAVAYLNTDSCVAGNRFHPSASPFLSHLLIEVTKKIPSPKNDSRTLYEDWIVDAKRHGEFKDGEVVVKGPRGGTDHVPFAYYGGITSIDLGFEIDRLKTKVPLTSHVYPAYHTGFDTFYYVDRFIDPGYKHTRACGLINALVLHELAEAALLPFNLTNYAKAVVEAFDHLKNVGLYDELLNVSIRIDNLESEIQKFVAICSAWQEALDHTNKSELQENPLLIRALNDQLTQLEQNFINPQGIPEQPQYRHMVFALSLHDIYGSSSFPGIVDLMHEIKLASGSTGDPRWKELEKHISDLIVAFHQAGEFLKPFHLL